MTKLWETLSKENKEKLSQVYEKLTGKKWMPKIENLSELEKIMRERPNPTKRK